MNKRAKYCLEVIFCLSAIAFCTIFSRGADATSYLRQNPTDVIPPDWVGTWDCNLNGRSVVLKIDLEDETVCNGDLCGTIPSIKLAGSVSDDGTSWQRLEKRDFSSNDPPTSRQDHLLPLQDNNQNQWFLIMHTENRDYLSGYITQNSVPFGLQCQRK